MIAGNTRGDIVSVCLCVRGCGCANVSVNVRVKMDGWMMDG